MNRKSESSRRAVLNPQKDNIASLDRDIYLVLVGFELFALTQISDTRRVLARQCNRCCYVLRTFVVTEKYHEAVFVSVHKRRGSQGHMAGIDGIMEGLSR